MRQCCLFLFCFRRGQFGLFWRGVGGQFELFLFSSGGGGGGLLRGGFGLAGITGELVG